MGKRAKRAIAAAAVVAFTAAAGAAGAATEAWASIPASDGSIHACYKTADIGQGQLYVIDSSAACPTGYTELDWNQSGISGYQVVSHTETATSVTISGISSEADCPTGKKALGGGGGGDEMLQSQPVLSSGVPTGWLVNVTKQNPSGSYDVSATTYVICATVGS